MRPSSEAAVIFSFASYIFSLIGGLVLWFIYFQNISFLSELNLEYCTIDKVEVTYYPPFQNHTGRLFLNLTFFSSFAELRDSIITNGNYDELIETSKTYKIGEQIPCLVYRYGFYGQIINKTFHRMFMGNIFLYNPINYSLSYLYYGFVVISFTFLILDILARYKLICKNVQFTYVYVV